MKATVEVGYLSTTEYSVGTRWNNDPLVKAEILQFVILAQPGDSMQVDIEPVYCVKGGNTAGDYCFAPHFVIKKGADNTVIVAIFDEFYIEDGDVLKEIKTSFQYDFEPEEVEEIKKTDLFALNTELGARTNKEIADEFVEIIDKLDCDRYFARDIIFARYKTDPQSIKRTTWVMHNMLEEDKNNEN